LFSLFFVGNFSTETHADNIYGNDCNSPDDFDNDCLIDKVDNCWTKYNPDQKNTDGDSEGDVCDDDIDDDGWYNDIDNCKGIANNQDDSNANGVGDECDLDVDGDGVQNEFDNCFFIANADQLDSDDNGTGDACQMDPGLNLEGGDYLLQGGGNGGCMLTTDAKRSSSPFVSILVMISILFISLIRQSEKY